MSSGSWQRSAPRQLQRDVDYLIGVRVHIRRFDRQDLPGDAIRAIGRKALASGLVGVPVDFEGNINR